MAFGYIGQRHFGNVLLNDHGWNELLDEFRALGGTAENIRRGESPLGRGLFPADPSKPVNVRVPENLLIASKNFVFRDGVPRVSYDVTIGERERAWLNRYQEEFSWGDGGRGEIERMFAAAQELPEALRLKLLTEFRCGVWFGNISDEAIQQRFLRTHEIEYNGEVVIPPILEFANHGVASGFGTLGGLSIEGSFPGEVLVQYDDIDAFGIFQAWGFAFASPVALSIALNGAIQSVPLSITRERSVVDPVRGGWMPALTHNSGGDRLSFLLLGHEQYPRLAKGIFYHLMREAGYSEIETCFSGIQEANRAYFQGLLEGVRGLNYPIARTLAAVAEYQLRAMAFSRDFP